MDTITEFAEDSLDEAIDIDGSIDYSRGYVHHNLFLPYETLKAILKLDEKTRAIDEVLLNSSHVAIEHYLCRILSKRKISEDVFVKDAIITPREIPIKKIVSLVDVESQRDVDLSEITFSDKEIKVSVPDGNLCRLQYEAGYNAGEGEPEMVEAVIKTFLSKRHCLYIEMNESQDLNALNAMTYELTDEVKELLKPFKR